MTGKSDNKRRPGSPRTRYLTSLKKWLGPYRQWEHYHPSKCNTREMTQQYRQCPDRAWQLQQT